MPIYVSDNGGGGNFTPHPTGLFQMVCCDVIENGMCDTAYGPKRMVTLRWQSVEENDKGQRMTVQQRYNATLNEKANLRKDLEAWRGKAFTVDEVRRFDIETLIGVNAMVNVVHRQDAAGKTWANVASLAPLMKNLPKLSVSSDYVRQQDREQGPTADDVPPHDDSDAGVPF